MSETTQSSTQQPAPEAGEGKDQALSPLEEAQKKLQESEAKYLYLYAEFENYKKRAVKERVDSVKFAVEPFARELLMVVDNLERGLAHVSPQTDQNLVEGLRMVLSQFKGVLSQQGIQVVESMGKPFDANVHEAVGTEPSDQPSGVITQEHQRGYTLHGRLLRPSRVIVSSGRAPSEASPINEGH